MRRKLFLIILLLFPLYVHADKKAIFSIDEVTASPGNNVTINFKLDNNKNFGILTARIKYDNSKITYVDSELKGLSNGLIKGIEENNQKGLVAVYGITLNKKKPMNDNGIIATIEFKIADNVTEDIPLTIDIKDFGVDESTSIEYDTKDGIIHINSNVETVTSKQNKSINEKIKDELKKQGIDEKDLTIESSNDDVAIVKEDGSIELKEDGNATITVKDKNGNVIYTKDYFVKKKINKYKRYIVPGMITLLVIVFFVVIIVIKRKKKCQKEK